MIAVVSEVEVSMRAKCNVRAIVIKALVFGLVTAGTIPAPAAGADAQRGAPGLQPPLPVWPSDLETITQRSPVFRLNGRFEATRYRVELADNEGFTSPTVITDVQVADASGIAPVVLAPSRGELLTDGRYYWRAFCAGDEGAWTPAANHRTFAVATDDVDRIDPPGEIVHPRLLLRREDVEKLERRVSRSEHLQRGWQYQLNTALSALELDPPGEDYARAGEGQHGSYSTAASWYHRHMENVAFVATVTGNRRLAKKGVEMLMTACSYERWLGPLFDKPAHFDPPWHSALETAMMTEAVAVGYDLLYPHLTDDQRVTVREALADKGIRMLVLEWADPAGSSQLPRHQTPTGNWVMVCAGSAGVGALAILGEHPEAAEWVRLVQNRVRAWLTDRGGDYYVDSPNPQNRPDPIPVIGPSEPNFGIDGGYKESLGYMNYGTRYACFFADALRRTTNRNLFEHVPDKLFDPMAWSVMARSAGGGIKSTMIDFGDNGDTTAWFADLYACLIRNRRDPRAAWLYRRTIPSPRTPRSLLWYDGDVLEAPPDTAVPMGVFRGIGQVIMRRGWSPDTPMAAIKFHQNRGHHDIGAFYLFGAGQPTLIDSGVTDYGSRIYREYSSTSVGHNVVLVDDRPQVKTDGRMLAAVGTSRITAASGELSAAYPGALASWTRDLVMLPDGVAIVLDRLAGHGPHQFDLVLHPENPFSLIRPGRLVLGPEDRSTLVDVLSDGRFTAAELDGYHQTVPRKYVRFNADEPAEHRAFLTVCRWPIGRAGRVTDVAIRPAGPGRWRIDQTDTGSAWAVRIGEADDDAVRSDARLTAVWSRSEKGGQRHAIVLAGQRLAVAGRELLHATVPINAAIEFDLPLRAHVWSPVPARVVLNVEENVRKVYLDGVEIHARRDRDTITVDLPAGECRLLATDLDRPMHRLASLVVDDLPAVEAGDAPAYRPGVLTRSSSSWSDGHDAIDGDPNTAWISMPGEPMPQWLEIELPDPEPMSAVTVDTGLPAAGRVETWNPATRAWEPRGSFEATPERTAAGVTFDEAMSDRIRVVVERIDPVNASATIHSIRWTNAKPGPTSGADGGTRGSPASN